MTDLNFNMDIPKSHLFIIIAITFLLAGGTIGFLVGNYTMNENWKQYNELKEEQIARDCICINKTIENYGGFKIGN